MEDRNAILSRLKTEHETKFVNMDRLFKSIRPGDRVFIGTGCGEPQHLVKSMIEYVMAHPKAFFDAELLQVVTLGAAPYADERLKFNFRHNSFFIGNSTREAINQGLADYTPVFLSQVPKLFSRKFVPIDVALIQTSLPDEHGYVSLGVSVDIVRAAAESAKVVIAQINSRMPRVHGDTFLNIRDITYIIHHDEPLLEYAAGVPDEIAEKIGRYVSRIVQDGDTIQVGYGSLPNAILRHLGGKKHLGVHTELLTDGVIDLIRNGAVDNSLKQVNLHKTVASFCMGSKATYEFINDNPSFDFRPVDFTNNPLVIARNHNMTAINSAIAADLTGQATAESIGRLFYSGIGGQADFMRGAVLSQGGKTILALQSTAGNGTISRIVPFLREGSGVTLNRGDLHYVVTEYGIAYLHGKSIRERAMDMVAIAHPKFRAWLVDEAKKDNIIYQDQTFVPGERGLYPDTLETHRTSKTGMKLLLRPVRLNDESILKEFFYSLSEDSMYFRFISTRKDFNHERLLEFTTIDYTKEMVMLAIYEQDGHQVLLGVGQYIIDEEPHTAEIAVVVKDDCHNMGIGSELVSYLVYLAKKSGLVGFTASVLLENKSMLHVFEKTGFLIEKRNEGGMYALRLPFRD